MSSEGWRAQTFLPGAWVVRPSAEQSPVWAAYLARFHAALAEVVMPGWLSVPDNAWRRADALDLQLGELRDETLAYEPIEEFRDAYDRCAARVLEGRPYLDAMRLQLIHADASSENTLWNDDGPTLIDFTPYAGHHLMALAVSHFWHHVYFNDLEVEIERVLGEIEAYSEAWTGAALDAGAFPLLLARVALWQLAQVPARSAVGEVFSDAERLRLVHCADAILDAEPELARRLG